MSDATPGAPQPSGSPHTSVSRDKPHPKDSGFVGRYVHSYDPSRQQYQSHIPSMRPAQDVTDGYSTTPIYDALYSEWRRAFRALPGDRSNEENLGFTAFGIGSGAHARTGREQTSYPGSWQRDQRQPPGRHAPAALPPGPRRGM